MHLSQKCQTIPNFKKKIQKSKTAAEVWKVN